MAHVYSRILIAGAGGFVGPRVLASLAERFPGAQLVGTRFKDGETADIELDIRDTQAVDRIIAEFAPDGVVHPAAISQVQ